MVTSYAELRDGRKNRLTVPLVTLPEADGGDAERGQDDVEDGNAESQEDSEDGVPSAADQLALGVSQIKANGEGLADGDGGGPTGGRAARQVAAVDEAQPSWYNGHLRPCQSPGGAGKTAADGRVMPWAGEMVDRSKGKIRASRKVRVVRAGPAAIRALRCIP